MVYSEEMEPKRGQEYRDRVRCDALEKIGHKVYTLDDKHNGDRIKSGRHCQANFADSRRMHKMMRSKWGNIEFDNIILDYFFSPSGWARTRWTEAFFKDTLPMLVTSDILKPNGSIFLPNLDCVEELLYAYEKILGEHFMWDKISKPAQNPLYRSTERCQKELLKCPDMLTNATQMLPLHDFSPTPFIILKRMNRSYEKRNASGELIRRGAVVHFPTISMKKVKAAEMTAPDSPSSSSDVSLNDRRRAKGRGRGSGRGSDQDPDETSSSDDSETSPVLKRRRGAVSKELADLRTSWMPGY